jgi:hypothetical protein
MKKIEFTKDFANSKKGDVISLSSILASQLVTVEKVAKYWTDEKPKKPKK